MTQSDHLQRRKWPTKAVTAPPKPRIILKDKVFILPLDAAFLKLRGVRG